jgi:hypothetical protein
MKNLRTWWRDLGKRWWSDYHWLVLLLAGLVALFLGLVGFIKNGIANGESRTLLDNLYLTLGLISMNTGAVSGPVSWELQVARFLVPAVMAYTALLALAVVFTEKSQQARLWFLRDHIIICGLGRKGIRLAKQFRDRGDHVVVIEPDEDNNWIETCRTSGIIVLNDDASELETLRKARLNRSRYLISVVGDDGVNAEIAVQAEELSRHRKAGTLTCSIHIVDPQLWYLLREKEFSAAPNTHFRLELFNIFDRGASLLLQMYAPWNAERQYHPRSQHLVLIGLGKLGQSLVVQAASQWREIQPNTSHNLKFSIIDLDANAGIESLCVRYPHLGDITQLESLQMDVHSADFQRADFLYDHQGNCVVEGVYICMDNDSLGLHTGLTLHKKIRDLCIPVVIRMTEDAGLALLLHDQAPDKTGYKHLHAFPLLDHTCTPDLILRGTHELLARELHQAYLDGLKKDGLVPEGSPSLTDWEDLPEEVKERNRMQADRIARILEQHGYRIVPLTDWIASDMVFRGDEILSMARMEHELWCQVMQEDGWQYAPERSVNNKTNPDLVPWDQLPPEEVEKNEKFIRDLPRVLSRSGFQVERRNPR